MAFWSRPKIFGQFSQPKWPNSQNSQFSAKFWPNNTHNIVLILIRNGLAFGRGQRFFWPVCPAKLAKRPNANLAITTLKLKVLYIGSNITNIKVVITAIKGSNIIAIKVVILQIVIKN